MSAPLRLIVPAILVFALAGCSAGGGVPDPADGGGAAAGGSIADCAIGHTWSADVPDIGVQLLSQLQANGSPATSAVAAGSQVLTWGADGQVQVATDYTFTVVSPLSDGLVLTMTQRHAGPTVGALTLVGDTATPTSWDASGYLITTVMDINGEAASMDFPMPDASLTDVPLTVTCEGNSMTTFAAPGFVTTKWSRTD